MYSVTSPPPIERNDATKFAPMFALRTVMPITSPSTASMRYPGTSLVVTMITAHIFARGGRAAVGPLSGR